MNRYREISSAEMTSVQKEVHDEIVAGRRGRFGGPFQILIRAPEVCRHLQRLGEYLRWGSSLPPALSELAICLTRASPACESRMARACATRGGGRGPRGGDGCHPHRRHA